MMCDQSLAKVLWLLGLDTGCWLVWCGLLMDEGLVSPIFAYTNTCFWYPCLLLLSFLSDLFLCNAHRLWRLCHNVGNVTEYLHSVCGFSLTTKCIRADPFQL